MATPKAVKKALEHVHELFPQVIAVVFTANGNWLYMDEDGNSPSFEGEPVNQDLLEAAGKAADRFSVYRWYPPVEVKDNDLIEFLDGVMGCVEANSFETHQLWETYHYHAEKLGYTKCTWEQEMQGTSRVVGYVQVNGEDMPVNVSLFVNVVDGHRILFYDPCSRCVDHEMVRDWLKKVLPETAFRSDGYINNVDANNFHNVLPGA